MPHFKGQTITLYERTQISVNPINEPIYAESVTQVSNVFIETTSAEEIKQEMELFGRHSVYTLHIPKGDNHNWLNSIVVLGGQYGQRKFKQFGDITVYDSQYCPLDWDKKIKVEVYE